MRYETAVLAVVGALVLGLVGIGGGTAALDTRQAAAGTDTTANTTATISVSGVGEASADPDRALVAVAVTATGDSPSAATERLAANVSDLREAFEDENETAVAQLQTTGYNVFEQRENGTTTYVARQSFELTVADVQRVGDVVDRAVAAGATEVGGVTFTLSRERHREVRGIAIDRAATDARAEADAVAASTDLTLGEIRSVSTANQGFGPGPTLEQAGDAGTVIEPSPVRVTASVQITYNATTG